MQNLRSTLWVGSTYCHIEKVVKNILDLPYSLPRPMAIYRKENCLLTPGEYIENPWYFSALLVSSYDVEVVVFVYLLGEPYNPYPPATAGAFNRDVIGVLIIPNSVSDNLWHQIEEAQHILELAGAMNICIVVDKIGDNICEEVSSMCDKRGFIYGYDALRNILVAQKNNNI